MDRAGRDFLICGLVDLKANSSSVPRNHSNVVRADHFLTGIQMPVLMGRDSVQPTAKP